MGGGKFRDVAAKLLSGHEVVHGLIIRLGRAADALAEDPREANFVQAANICRKLEEVVRSHFGYEETELADAIGYSEDSVDDIANARMGKRRWMRWSPKGAHRVTVTRAAVFDRRLTVENSKRAA